MSTLDDRKQMRSDLWLDQPDAHERIDQKRREGSITEVEATQLRQFTDDGYLKASLALDGELTDAFARDVERLWRERPADLAAAAHSGDRIAFRDFDQSERTVGYRIVDMHSHSQAALDLYLHDQLFRLVELIFGEEAVAFQSLYFTFGSEQGLHRDPMFVVTDPPWRLVASWVALEEITADSGPLRYVPGSHRLPWHEFEPDKIAISAPDKRSPAVRKDWASECDNLIREMELEPQELTCGKGDAFIWHAGLLHGGAKVRNEGSTRKSFVTHYSTAATYSSRRATMKERAVRDGQEKLVGVGRSTDRMLVQNGHRGLDNPLRLEPDAQIGEHPVPEPLRMRGAGAGGQTPSVLSRLKRKASSALRRP